jgi:hypothetical protein
MVLSRPGEWQQISTVNVKGTYPSIATDSRGRIHMSFRSPGDRWSLDYCRFQDGFWTPPQRLVVAEKPGYIYWTNGLAVGPNDALHLVFGNTRVREDESLLYGRRTSSRATPEKHGAMTMRKFCPYHPRYWLFRS